MSELVSKENYIVQIDSTYAKPSYDLANFVQSFSEGMPQETITNFQKIEKTTIKSVEKTFWQSAFFMWICIVLGGAVIAYFAYGLLKDMKE